MISCSVRSWSLWVLYSLWKDEYFCWGYANFFVLIQYFLASTVDNFDKRVFFPYFLRLELTSIKTCSVSSEYNCLIAGVVGALLFFECTAASCAIINCSWILQLLYCVCYSIHIQLKVFNIRFQIFLFVFLVNALLRFYLIFGLRGISRLK